MACFLVPAAEAIIVTAAYAVAKKKEQKLEAPKLAQGKTFGIEEPKVKWSRKLSWLLSMLWGGVLLLAFEHFWHGEIQPFAPFITAMATPEDTAEMLRELLTVGVSMSAFVTAAWAGACAVVDVKVKKLKEKSSRESA